MTPASVHLSCGKQSRGGEDGEEQFLAGWKGRQKKWLEETYRRKNVGWVLGKREECSPALRAGVTSSLSLIWNGIYSIIYPQKGCSYPTEAQHPTYNMASKLAYFATTAAQASGISLCGLSSAGFEGKRHLFIPAWAPLNTLVWRCRDTPP